MLELILMIMLIGFIPTVGVLVLSGVVMAIVGIKLP